MFSDGQTSWMEGSKEVEAYCACKWEGGLDFRAKSSLDFTIFLRNLHIFFGTCHNFSLLFSVQIIIIPACCLLCVL